MVDYLILRKLGCSSQGKGKQELVRDSRSSIDLHATTLCVHYVNVRTKVKRHNDSVVARLQSPLDVYSGRM